MVGRIIHPDLSLWSCSGWMGQVLVHWKKDETSNFLIIVDSGDPNVQGTVWETENWVWSSSRFTSYMKSPCQLFTSIILFIKYGPSLSMGRESISADKFLFQDHVKCIFLLKVHITQMNLFWTICQGSPFSWRLSWIPKVLWTMRLLFPVDSPPMYIIEL